MHRSPYITVITVCYNSAATIAETIRSVAKQTYKDIEHVVIDGQSTDETLCVVEANRHCRLVINSEPDSGIYDAMNKGLNIATGEVVGILNSDDFYLHEGVLSEVVAAFSADPKLDVVLGGVDFVKSNDVTKPVRIYRANGFKLWMFRFGFMPPHPAAFVRKSAYERVGGYKTDYKIAADFDLLLRLLLKDGAKYHASKGLWVRMLIGGVSTSSWRSNVTITSEMRRSLRENGLRSNFLILLLRLPVKFFTKWF